MMRACLSGLCVLALSTASAFAQESAPETAWVGPYAGLTTGLASGLNKTRSIVECGSSGFLCSPDLHEPNGALLSSTASGSGAGRALIAGGLVGYNWRYSGVVAGLEADFTASRLSASKGGRVASLNPGLSNPDGPVISTIRSTAELDWLSTLRLRAGVLVTPGVLVYGTGGVAVKSVWIGNSYTDNWVDNGGAVGGAGFRERRTTYVVGAGAEWRADRRWTLRMEYIRVGAASGAVSSAIRVVEVPAAENSFASSSRFSTQTLRLGAVTTF